MKVVHLIGGGDVGGAKTHVFSLLQRLSRDITVSLVSLREGDFAREARELGIDTEVIPGNNPLRVARRLADYIREGGYDLIHCHGAKANVLGALLRRRLKLPVVTTIHSDYRRDYMGQPLKMLTNGLLNTAALRRIDFYTAVSDSFADMLIDRGFDPHRIFTIYHGMRFDPDTPPLRQNPTARAAYLRELGLDCRESDIIVGIAARFHPVKDLSTLIRAFALAAEKELRLKLVIGGDGDERQRLTELVRQLGLTDRVCFAGWISDMDRFLGALDINTLTSLTESFPYSVLEGIRCGCATVTSRVGGMPGLIDHGVNGYIFDPGNAEMLSEYILTYALDPEKRALFALRLHRKAERRYSMDAMGETQLSIYRTVLRRAAQPRRRRNIALLCGAYGRGNLGDDAIMESIVAQLRGIDPDLKIVVVSRNPRDTRRACRINTVHTFSMLRQFFLLLRTRLYINGGGTLIQDTTSTRSLMYYLTSIRIARLCGASVMLYGCGIGPVTRPRNRRIAGRVLNRCAHAVTLRDSVSLGELHSLGVTRPDIQLSADPTITLPPAPDEAADTLFAEAGIPARDMIGFSVRSWKQEDTRICEAVARAADHAVRAHGLVPVFIPMTWPDDIGISEKTISRMRERGYLLRGRLSCSEAAAVLGRMRAVAAMRLHALVLSAPRGIPLVGISYDIKVESFLRYTGHSLFVKFEELTAEELCCLVDRAAAQRRGAVTGEMQALLVRERINTETARRLLEDRIK